MSRQCAMFLTVFTLALGVPAGLATAAEDAPAAQQDRLIAVLKSDAPQKEKSDACLMLARIGAGACVPVLAGMLGDEKLSHMARYALEPIPGPAVDEAFRGALGKTAGRPLAGVICSIGARRDAQAVDALADRLTEADPVVVQAAARALGGIGTVAAGAALMKQASGGPAARQLAICEGLFRCAERLTTGGQRDAAITLYDHLSGMKETAHQVRTGAIRGSILARGKSGIPLLSRYLRDKDYGVFAAACRAGLEVPGTEATQELIAVLAQLPVENQILVIQTLGRRGDPSAVTALSAMANAGAKAVRLAAIRSLAEIGHAAAIPALEQAAKDTDPEVSQTATESLASFQPAQTQPAART